MNYIINCDKQIISLSSTTIMGILNITPDSFYQGSRTDENTLLQRAQLMLENGATILDIGGVSTRPFADKVGEEEELERVIPAIKAVKKEFPNAILSIDTFRSEVARQAVYAGAAIVNDISGGSLDPKMFQTVGALNVPYILMHLQGTPETMQIQPHYENIVTDVIDYFIQKIHQLRIAGVKDIILDVGFGFGKNMEHNYTLLRDLSAFNILELPLLVGISRKSMIYKPLAVTPDEALNGTTFLHAAALQNGANILRVHDVKQAAECLVLHKLLYPK